MKTSPKLRSRIFSLAWQIHKELKSSFSEALKKAWATAKILMGMRTKAVSFAFVKANGEVRHAVGSFKNLEMKHTKKKGKPSLAIKYFDLDCVAWRSFRADRLLLNY